MCVRDGTHHFLFNFSTLWYIMLKDSGWEMDWSGFLCLSFCSFILNKKSLKKREKRCFLLRNNWKSPMGNQTKVPVKKHCWFLLSKTWKYLERRTEVFSVDRLPGLRDNSKNVFLGVLCGVFHIHKIT